MSGLSPIERFFGLRAGDGPLSLLGLEPAAISDERVHSALRTRLERLDRHPHGRTLEADEARLALHAAASQLLDPHVRAHLIEHYRAASGAPGRPQVPPSLTPPPAPARTEEPEKDTALLAFRVAAISLVTRAGGWNARSMRRVAALAHAMGLGVDDVHRALHLRPAAVGVPAPRAAAPPPAASVRRAQTRHRGTPRLGLAAIGASLAIVAVAVIIANRAGEPTLTPAPREPAPPAPQAGATEPQPPAPPVEQRPIEIVIDRSTLFTELRRAVEMAEASPGEGAWRMEESVAWLADNWWSLTQAERRSATDLALAFVQRATPGGPARRRAIEAIGRGGAALAVDAPLDGASVSAAAWSVGAIVALAQERDMPVALHLELNQRLAAAMGEEQPEAPTFSAAAAAALARAIDRMTGDRAPQAFEASWIVWRRCAAAVASESAAMEAIVERSRLRAVDALLRRGPSVSRTPEARRVASALLGDIVWGPAPTEAGVRHSTTRLLGWFDDETIDTQDLAVITEWLALESDAPGVGFAMVLPRSAGFETRAAYRDRYADAWAPTLAGVQDAIENVWARAARDAHSRVGAETNILGALTHAIELARLNEAAAHRWRRDIPAARAATLDPRAGVEQIIEQARGAGREIERRGSADWAVAYLTGPQNTTGRLEALQMLDNRAGPLDAVSGDVLAEIALWSTPLEVRRRAQWIARARIDDPAFINGLLEALPRAPQNSATTDLLEEASRRRLAPPGDPAWTATARRALVERLLELLSGQGDLGVIDALRDLLADAYAGAEGSQRPPSQPAPDPLAPASAADAHSLIDAATALRQRWEREARRYDPNPYAVYPLVAVERRLAARRRIASGPVQAFVAEQLAIVELMAFIVSAERPAAAADVREVVAELEQRRRAARHVMHQVEGAEHAVLRLWWIRFGADPLRAPERVGMIDGGAR